MSEAQHTSVPPARYKVIRNVKLPPGGKTFDEKIAVASGLPYEDARALSDRLEREEIAAQPRKTSWTRDIFYCERENEMSTEALTQMSAEMRAHILMLPSTSKYDGLAPEVIYAREEAKLRQEAETMSTFARRQVTASRIKAARGYEQTAARSRLLADAIALLATGKPLDEAISETLHREPTANTNDDRNAVIAEPPIDTEARVVRLDVDHHRLFIGGVKSAWANWTTQPAGDIHRSGSSMAIAKGRINTPFKLSGHLFVSVAGVAVRVVPAAEYPHPTFSYREKQAARAEPFKLYENTPPEEKLEFCEGIRVEYKNKQFVLTGPCLVFTSHRFGFTNEKDRDLYVQLTSAERQTTESPAPFTPPPAPPRQDDGGKRKEKAYVHGTQSQEEADQLGLMSFAAYTVFVDDARIEEGGDIHRAISGVPGYLREGKIKRPFRFGGEHHFVAICAHFDESRQQPSILAMRAVPPAEYDGQPAITRAENLPVEGEAVPDTKQLDGKVFTYGSKEYVLTLPILFVQKKSLREAAAPAQPTTTPKPSTDAPEIIRVPAERLLHSSEDADIPKSLSVYEIGQGRIKGTFEHEGQLYVALGSTLEPHRSTFTYVRAIRLATPDAYEGETHTYGEDNPLIWRDGIRYEGCRVQVADTGVYYVMTGPQIRFMPIEEPDGGKQTKGPKEIIKRITDALKAGELRAISKEESLHDLSRFRVDSQQRIVTALLARHLELREQTADASVPVPLQNPITVPASRLEYTDGKKSRAVLLFEPINPSSGDILTGVDVSFTVERFTTDRWFSHEGRTFIGVAVQWDETRQFFCLEIAAHEIVRFDGYSGSVYLPEQWLKLDDVEKAKPENGCLFLLCGAPCVMIGTPYFFRNEGWDQKRNPETVVTPTGDDADTTQMVIISRQGEPPLHAIARATGAHPPTGSRPKQTVDGWTTLAEEVGRRTEALTGQEQTEAIATRTERLRELRETLEALADATRQDTLPEILHGITSTAEVACLTTREEYPDSPKLEAIRVKLNESGITTPELYAQAREAIMDVVSAAPPVAAQRAA